MSPPTIADALRTASAMLAAARHEAARLEAEVLLGAAAGLSRSQLFTWPERRLDATAAARFDDWVQRRAAGEPVAYLLGRREFFGLDLVVTPATLIPRPETELLVELALAALPAAGPIRCADLGTGSGAVAIALAHQRPGWTLIAVERAAETLAVAAANAARLGLANWHGLHGDWLAAVAAASLDAVVSNPPYVRADDPHLSRGDLRFEPAAALVAGADGLEAIRTIAGQAARCLRPAGWLAIEHGWDQGEAVRGLLRQAGFEAIATAPDLAGHERVTHGLRRT